MLCILLVSVRLLINIILRFITMSIVLLIVVKQSAAAVSIIVTVIWCGVVCSTRFLFETSLGRL